MFTRLDYDELDHNVRELLRPVPGSHIRARVTNAYLRFQVDWLIDLESSSGPALRRSRLAHGPAALDHGAHHSCRVAFGLMSAQPGDSQTSDSRWEQRTELLKDAALAKSEQKWAKKMEDSDNRVGGKLEALKRRMAQKLADNKANQSTTSNADSARTVQLPRQGWAGGRREHRPRHVDIKGFSEYPDRFTEGIPGPEAASTPCRRC